MNKKFNKILLISFLLSVQSAIAVPKYTADSTIEDETMLDSRLHNNNDVDSVYETDVEIFVRLKRDADRGNAEAQCDLGDRYNTGSGVDENQEEALRYYKLSASQNYAPAQYAVGIIYAAQAEFDSDTEDAERANWEKALEYFALAAAQGDQNAQKEYGKAQMALNKF